MPRQKKEPRDPFRAAGLLPLSEAARKWNSHHQTLKRAVEEGRLPAARHGKNRLYVSPADLDAYFAGRQVEPAA